MTFTARARSLFEWYRALRALNRILATMGVALLCLTGYARDQEAPAGAGPRTGNATDHSGWYEKAENCGSPGRVDTPRLTQWRYAS